MSDTDTTETEIDYHKVVAIGPDADEGNTSVTAYYPDEESAREATEILAAEWETVLLFGPDTGTDEVYEERAFLGAWSTLVRQVKPETPAPKPEEPKAKHAPRGSEPLKRVAKKAKTPNTPAAAKPPAHKAKKVAKPVI